MLVAMHNKMLIIGQFMKYLINLCCDDITLYRYAVIHNIVILHHFHIIHSEFHHSYSRPAIYVANTDDNTHIIDFILHDS